jgi:hypothetical protein
MTSFSTFGETFLPDQLALRDKAQLPATFLYPQPARSGPLRVAVQVRDQRRARNIPFSQPIQGQPVFFASGLLHLRLKKSHYFFRSF